MEKTTEHERRLKHVMHVDDDDDIRLIVRMSLELSGDLEITQCASGQEALDAIAQAKPELILLDVMMPNMDGEETLSRIREIDGFSATPVVFMTAKTETSAKVALMSAGAVSVIIKPFDPLELSNLVQSIWNTTQAA